MSAIVRTGGCLCGAVKLAITGDPVVMTCGSPVMNDHPSIGLTDIPAVSIPDLVFEPKLHSHYPEKILSIRDGLPKYKDFDPAVGGSDEVVPE